MILATAISLIKFFDIFAFPISLTYKNSAKVGTLVGGLLTFIVYGLFVCMFLLVSSELWNRERPLVYQSSFNSQTKMYLKDIPMRLLFFDSNNNPVSDHKVFLMLYVSINSMSEQGKYQLIERDTIRCQDKLSQFSPQAQQQLNDSSLPYSICLDFEDTDYLDGDFPTANTNFFNLFIWNMCSKEDREKCVSDAETQQLLVGSYMVIQFNGITIEDNNNYKDPISQNTYSSIINFSSQIYKQFTFNIGASTLKSDDGLLFPNVNNYSGMKMVSQSQDFSDSKSQTANGSALLNVLVGWSKQQLVINRVYMKIPEALAKTMGFMSVILWFFHLIMGQYEQFSFKSQIYKEMIKKRISIQKNQKGNFEFISKEKKNKNSSIIASKEPDKIKRMGINFFYYSLIRFCNWRYYLMQQSEYKQFQLINEFTNDVMSLERLFKTIIGVKKNKSKLSINQNQILYSESINQEFISDMNVKLSTSPKQFLPQFIKNKEQAQKESENEY